MKIGGWKTMHVRMAVANAAVVLAGKNWGL